MNNEYQKHSRAVGQTSVTDSSTKPEGPRAYLPCLRQPMKISGLYSLNTKKPTPYHLARLHSLLFVTVAEYDTQSVTDSVYRAY